jgi:hypothetical protein
MKHSTKTLEKLIRRARALPKKVWVPLAVVGLLALVTIPVIAQGTLFVEGNRVGIGTPTPGGNLHIYGGSSADTFNAIGPNATTDAFNFGYSGGTFGNSSGFFNVRPGGGASGPNPALYFATSNVERMVIDNQGFIAVHMDGSLGGGFNPAHPIHAQQTGARLTTGGVWTNASSRELKENIRSLDLSEARATLMSLEPVLYNYKVEADDTQVGFIAEDLPELVATPDRKTLAPGEIVGVLTRVVQEQQRTIDELSKALDELRRDVERDAVQ